ncbi:MAG: GTP-binding protein [Nitrospinota bacterium]
MSGQSAPAAGVPAADLKVVLRVVAVGSVDDGKSTLIGRLLYDSESLLQDQIDAVARASRRRGEEELDLSLLTDGLIDEREQGITIDVAYRYFATPRRKFILADVPGHEQYTRNMATGASTADLGVVVVDAQKGMTRQSRRHLYLLRLFGVGRVIVAVNKMDLVDYAQEVFTALRAELEAFARRIGLEEVRAVPVSAKSGDNVVHPSIHMPWHAGPPLLEVLESAPLEAGREIGPLRFPVQGVVRPGAGVPFRLYLGQLKSGAARPGDEVVVHPGGLRSRVREVRASGGPLEEAAVPQSVMIALEDEIDVARGSLIASAEEPPRVSDELNALVFWMAEKPLDPRRAYLLKIGARVERAKVLAVHARIDVDSLAEEAGGAIGLNDIARVALRVQSPVAHDLYAENRATGAFILIDPDTNDTVGGGTISL